MLKQLHESQLILDSMPCMVWFKDSENRILRANRAAADATGLEPEEMIGLYSEEIFGELADEYAIADRQVMHSGMPLLGQVEQLTLKDGHQVTLLTDRIPFAGDTPGSGRLLMVSTDISEAILLRAELRAQQLERMRAEVAHEVAMASEERFRSIANMSAVLMWSHRRRRPLHLGQ
ncbi:MAG: PAS domain S-box protein [Planctomycetota bacterium]